MNNLWKLSNFKSIPFCNTYSLHVLPTEPKPDCKFQTIIVDINGIFHWLNKSLTFDLKKYLINENGDKINNEFSLELVASDTSMFVKDDLKSFAYLATCWVIYDQLFAPERYIAAFYSITLNDEIEFWSKFDLNSAPTFSRLTITSPIISNELYWLVFSYSSGVLAYFVNHSNKTIDPIRSIGSIFPALEILQMPGSAIRSHCWIIKNYRFSVIGYDTGYAVASVCTMQNGTIIDRKTIKFSGPISVLQLINSFENELTTALLISSTLGPAAIWNLKLEDEVLVWEMTKLLLNSEIYDTIITSQISCNYIFIGTYGEQLLVYNIVDVFDPDFFEVFPMFVLNIASPIVSIAFFEDERMLVVLSYKGAHTFMSCYPPQEMLFSISTPTSQILTSPITALSPSNLAQIFKQTLTSPSIKKSPLVFPTTSTTSQIAWQLPVSAPANTVLNTNLTQNLKAQSYSLPQIKSPPLPTKSKQNSAQETSSQIPKQQQKNSSLQENK